VINQRIRNQLKNVSIFHPIIMVCFFSLLTQSLHGVALQDSPSLSTIETSMHYLQQPSIGLFSASMHLFSKPPSGFCSIIGRQLFHGMFPPQRVGIFL
jgi:hypothetical protein